MEGEKSHWHGTLINMEDSVLRLKSAYRVSRDDARRNRNINGGQGGSSGGGNEVWKELWKLRCPSKIKHFWGNYVFGT